MSGAGRWRRSRSREVASVGGDQSAHRCARCRARASCPRRLPAGAGGRLRWVGRDGRWRCPATSPRRHLRRRRGLTGDAGHDRFRTSRPPSRSPRSRSARRTTSSISASRRRRRRAADTPAPDDTVGGGPLGWLRMASCPLPAPVEPEARAAGWILPGGSVRRRSAPVRRGTCPGSVTCSASAASVRRTDPALHNVRSPGPGPPDERSSRSCRFSA